VQRADDLGRLPLDLHLCKRGMGQALVQVLPDRFILAQLRGECTALRIPARLPGLDDAEAEAPRMGLLSH
jgi:hypothetical protein